MSKGTKKHKIIKATGSLRTKTIVYVRTTISFTDSIMQCANDCREMGGYNNLSDFLASLVRHEGQRLGLINCDAGHGERRNPAMGAKRVHSKN
jgi:hypothetical protein